MHKSNVLRHLQSWKETFRARIRNSTECRSLSEADRRSLELALTLWISVCFDIVVRSSSLDAAASGFANAKSALKSEGALSYANIMNSLSDLDSVLVRHGFISRTDVRQTCKARWLRILMYRFVGLSVRDVHQACQFGKRLTLTSDPQLEDNAKSAYFANIERLRRLNASDFTNEESDILQEWTRTFRNPKWTDIRWGNGQVAQGLASTSQMRKAANHVAIPKTIYFERQIFDSPDEHWYFSRPRPVAVGPLEFYKGINDVGTPYDKVDVRAPHGKLQFVPKSFKTYRSICMEDLSLVPYQQAVFRAFDRWFSTTLGAHIDLQDQARSRAMAMIGSKYPSTYATIDLSMASDSVSEALVRKWFWHTPLRDCLYATRSGVAEYNGQLIDLPMFSAMGSASCFPLECVVFGLQVEATIRDIDGEQLGSLAPWCVYGDDICIETAYAPALIERLERNGFIVNKEKSYYTDDCYFREACGGEYYAGEDVTPVRISRNFRDFQPKGPLPEQLDARTLSSWYGLANALWRQGLWYARRFLLAELTERVPRGLIPWTNDESVVFAEAGSRVVYHHVKRGPLEYDIPESIQGFGAVSTASAVFTTAPVSYSCWDKDLQLGYNLVLGERVSDEPYYSLRGHLISSLQSSAKQEYSWYGDVSGRTAIVRQYEA